MSKIKNLQRRDFLKPWLQFRAYVKFSDGNKRHIFGREWPNITIEQIIWKHVVEVKLTRYNGYMDLVNAIETGFIAGKYNQAIIFQRDHTSKFNIMCRHYEKGELITTTVNDPVLEPEEQFLILHPAVENLHQSIMFNTAEKLKAELTRNFLSNENKNTIPADRS